MKKILLTMLIVITTATLVTGCDPNANNRDSPSHDGGHSH
jgi:hypothetical protein